MGFEGKDAIVTGASSGIGRQVAIDLSKKRCNLGLVGRDRERLLGVKDEVKKNDVKALAVTCDVSIYGNVKEMEVVGQIKPFTMANCLRCHREAHEKFPELNVSQGPENCSTCHR